MASTTSRRRKKSRFTDPRLLIGCSVLVILLLIILMFAFREDDSASDANAALIMPSAQDFTLPTLDGGEISLSDYRGQYVLVNFWASWCPPCKAEMPDLNRYHQEHQAQGFTLLAVNVNDDPVLAQEFIATYGYTFPVVLDYNGAVFNQFRAEALPSSFLIGPDGSVVHTWKAGALTPAMLEADITPRLTQS